MYALPDKRVCNFTCNHLEGFFCYTPCFAASIHFSAFMQRKQVKVRTKWPFPLLVLSHPLKKAVMSNLSPLSRISSRAVCALVSLET